MTLSIQKSTASNVSRTIHDDTPDGFRTTPTSPTALPLTYIIMTRYVGSVLFYYYQVRHFFRRSPVEEVQHGNCNRPRGERSRGIRLLFGCQEWMGGRVSV